MTVHLLGWSLQFVLQFALYRHSSAHALLHADARRYAHRTCPALCLIPCFPAPYVHATFYKASWLTPPCPCAPTTTRHPLIRGLKDKVAAAGEGGEEVATLGRLLYESSVLESGFSLEDPKTFTARVQVRACGCVLLQSCTAVALAVAYHVVHGMGCVG